jgi:ABC-2 type transport system permease protein
MHILKRELKANLKSLIIWALIMVIFIFLMVSEFSAYYNNPEMADILEALPEAMLKAFSMEGSNLTTTRGFISIASIYFYLLLSFYSIILATNIISKEERDKTAEFLMSMPISRKQVLISKSITCLINTTLMTLITGIAVVVFMLPYNLDFEFFKFIGWMLAALLITQWIYVSMGLFFASAFKRYKQSGKIAAALVMVFYILSVMSALTSKLSFLQYITPFKYFEAQGLIQNSGFELKFLLLSLLIIILGFVGTFKIYPNRDLNL